MKRGFRSGLAVVACMLNSLALAADERMPEGAGQYRLMLAVSTQAGSLAPFTPQNIQVPPGSGAGVGFAAYLVTSLISHSVNETQRQNVARRRTLDAHGAGMLIEELEAALRAEMKASKVPEMQLESVVDSLDIEQPGLLVRIKEPHILTIDSACRFNEAVNQFSITANLRFWQQGGVAPEREAALSYYSPAANGKPEDVFQHWTGNGFDQLRVALKAGAKDIAAQFSDSVQASRKSIGQSTEMGAPK